MNDLRTQRDNLRRLAHVGDDEAFVKRLNDAMSKLPSSNNNARLLASIQLASLHFLLCPPHSAAGQITHTDNRTDNSTAAGGFIGFSISRDERAGDTGACEVENYGGAAGGAKRQEIGNKTTSNPINTGASSS